MYGSSTSPDSRRGSASTSRSGDRRSLLPARAVRSGRQGRWWRQSEPGLPAFIRGLVSPQATPHYLARLSAVRSNPRDPAELGDRRAAFTEDDERGPNDDSEHATMSVTVPPGSRHPARVLGGGRRHLPVRGKGRSVAVTVSPPRDIACRSRCARADRPKANAGKAGVRGRSSRSRRARSPTSS
jgi:hypothetical protein